MSQRCDNCRIDFNSIKVWPLTCACGKHFASANAEGQDAPPIKLTKTSKDIQDIKAHELKCAAIGKHYLSLLDSDWVCDRIHSCACCTNRVKRSCGLILKTGKAGMIMHPKGVLKEETHCPIGRW